MGLLSSNIEELTDKIYQAPYTVYSNNANLCFYHKADQIFKPEIVVAVKKKWKTYQEMCDYGAIKMGDECKLGDPVSERQGNIIYACFLEILSRITLTDCVRAPEQWERYLNKDVCKVAFVKEHKQWCRGKENDYRIRLDVSFSTFTLPYLSRTNLKGPTYECGMILGYEGTYII